MNGSGRADPGRLLEELDILYMANRVCLLLGRLINLPDKYSRDEDQRLILS